MGFSQHIDTEAFILISSQLSTEKISGPSSTVGKSLGTKTVETTRCRSMHINVTWDNKEKVPSQFEQYWFALCWRKHYGQLYKRNAA